MKKLSQSGVFFVEGFQDARVVGVAAVALQQGFAFFAAVLAEVLVQQVHHGPQVAAFFHVDLEQVAQVVLAGRGQAQVALLLHRCRLGVALRDDDAAQVGAVFARHVLPGGFALVVTEVDLAVLLGGVQEDAPAVVGHLHVAELRPALRVHADGGAQVDVEVLRAVRAHVVPPLQVVGLPLLQRALQRAVFAQVDVVGDLVAVVDGGHGGLLQGFSFGGLL
jgi:hypothetical protein